MAKKEVKDEDGKTYVVKEKKPFYKRVWFWILILVIIIIAASTGNNKSDKENVEVSKSSTEESSEAPYKITDVKVEDDGDGDYYVTGILTNNTDADKSYVEVQFTAKDSDGNKLGDALDNVENLKAKSTWKFKAIYTGTADDKPTFDLENPEVTGF